jgi:hypothetical protein
MQNGSSLEVVLTPENVDRFSSGQNVTIEILRSLATCISPTGFTTVTIRCDAGARCPACLQTEQQVSPQSLSLVFYSPGTCTPDGIQTQAPPQLWWIAIVAVGAVLLILLVSLFVAAKKSDRVRDCLFPWRNHDSTARKVTTVE